MANHFFFAIRKRSFAFGFKIHHLIVLIFYHSAKMTTNLKPRTDFNRAELFRFYKFFQATPSAFPNGHSICKFLQNFLQIGEIWCYVKLWLRFRDVEILICCLNRVGNFLHFFFHAPNAFANGR